MMGMPKSPKLSEIVQEGYEYLQGFCPGCSKWRTMELRSLHVAPRTKIQPTTTLAQLTERMRCKECGAPMERVEPWRQSDQTGDTKPKFGALRHRPK